MPIKRNQQVTIIAPSPHAGATGRVIQIFRGWITIIQANHVAIAEEAKYIQPVQAS